MQRCAECGCYSHLGEKFEHFDGCVIEQPRKRQSAQQLLDILNRKPYQKKLDRMTGPSDQAPVLSMGTDQTLVKHLLVKMH